LNLFNIFNILSSRLPTGVSYQTKLNQNSIELNWTPIVRLGTVIKQNQTSSLLWIRLLNQSNQSNKINAIELNPIRFCSESISCRLKIGKSRRSNHNHPLLNGINRKTSQKLSNWMSMCGYTFLVEENKTTAKYWNALLCTFL